MTFLCRLDDHAVFNVADVLDLNPDHVAGLQPQGRSVS